ncbi:MAG: hypothetical protein QM484_12340 [Woeseiaceae bacterium]
MKRILIVLLILIVIIAGGGYFLFLKAMAPDDVPARVMNAEEAIATSGTIAIASVDMSYIRRIDKMFNPEKDPSALTAQDSAKPKTLLDKLKKQGVNLISETDYALSAINITEGKPTYSFVLFGNFSRDKLKKAISQYYRVDDSAGNYLLIEKVPEGKKIVDLCAKPSAKTIASIKQAIHIQNNRIVLSSPEMMPVILKRLKQKTRAGVSLKKWREFRKEKAVAGVFMSPKEANKGAVDLPSALLLGALSKQPLQDIYAGAVVSLLPSPGFTLLIDAHSNDAVWPLEVKTKYDVWLSEAVNELNEMPTLTALIQTLNVEADGNVLRFKTIADKQTLENIEKIPGEFLKMVFSGAFGETKTGPLGAEEIVKDEDIEKYKQNFDFSSIKSFDAKSAFYPTDHIVGPFGIRLERFGLLATDDSIIELTINAEGKGFENLSVENMHQSSDSPSASLSISRVEDNEGNNLLREELCGNKRNLASESLTTMRDNEHVNGQWIKKSIKVLGKKSVRLKQNVSSSQIAKVKGKVSIRAATRTTVKTLHSPFARKKIETAKVRMHLKKSNQGTVKYQLSGDFSHIMSVKAKNAKGQYLASAGSSSSGYEGTKMISKRFKGKVASIEVVVAEQMESQDYPFEINEIVPRYGKPGNGKKVEVKFTSKKRFFREYAKVKHKDACKNKQKVMLSGFLVCFSKYGERWGREMGGEFDVIAPYDESLQNDLSAVKLSIDKLVTESGKEISFDKDEKVNFVYKFDTNYNKKKKNWEILNRRLLGSNVKVFSDNEELKSLKIIAIKGTLTVRFPKHPKHFELDANKLGIVKKSKNGLIANVSAFEDWSTYIDFQGPVEKVMRMIPIAKDNTILSTGNDRIKEKQIQTWGMSKEEKEKLASLPKKWAGMITIYGQPEKIRIYYADGFEIMKHKFRFSIK